MKKCSALILLTCVFALLARERVAAAPVTWDFIATSCSGPVAGFASGGCDPKQQYPLTLASLTLSGPDSSGSAILSYPDEGLTLAGDPFEFDLVAGIHHPSVSTGQPRGTTIGTGLVVDYNISWNKVAGVLDSIRISFTSATDDIRNLDLTGGQVGSDFRIAGCVFDTCQVSGYWVDAPLVSLVTAPEPGSLALLASSFGVWGFAGRRCTRLTKPRARARGMRAADQG